MNSLETDRQTSPFKVVGWGFLGQGISSARNLALSILAGRLLGADTLGGIFLGFAVYLIALGFCRALIITPLVVEVGSRGGEESSQLSSRALTVLLAFGFLGSIVGLLGGVLLRGVLGAGVVAMSFWLLPALIQDFWRSLLFARGQGSRAWLNDLCTGLGMMLAAPLLYLVMPSVQIIVAVWGAGGLLAALVGFWQCRVTPDRLSVSWKWFKRDAWPFGKWLGVESFVFLAGSQLVVFAFAGILAPSALGGLRAAQSVFAPLTLIVPALSTPAVPVVAGEWVRSPRDALAYALRLSWIAVTLAAIFLLAAAVFGSELLSAIYGSSFSHFSSLIVPMGVGQVFAALAVGPWVLMRASKDGRGALMSQAINSAAVLIFGLLLAVAFDVRGAAWGLATGSMIGSFVAIVLGVRLGFGSRKPGGVDKELP